MIEAPEQTESMLHPYFVKEVYEPVIPAGTNHAIKVCLCPKSIWSRRTQSFGVEISKDGENYTELLPITEYLFDPDTANEVVLEFENTECMSVRLVFTGNSGAGEAQVAELEIYKEK